MALCRSERRVVRSSLLGAYVAVFGGPYSDSKRLGRRRLFLTGDCRHRPTKEIGMCASRQYMLMSAARLNAPAMVISPSGTIQRIGSARILCGIIRLTPISFGKTN